MTFTQQQRLDWQNEYLTRLCQADAEIAQTFDLMQQFATMLRERKGIFPVGRDKVSGGGFELILQA
jgi:hypothetical protein